MGVSYCTKLLNPTERLAKFVFSQITDIPASLSFVHLHGNIASLLQVMSTVIGTKVFFGEIHEEFLPFGTFIFGTWWNVFTKNNGDYRGDDQCNFHIHDMI